MTLLLTPTHTTGILLRHEPPSRHCYRHGAGGELSDDGLTERFYTPISIDPFPLQAPQQKKSREEILKTWKRTATKAALIYPTLQSQKSEHITNLALFTADRLFSEIEFFLFWQQSLFLGTMEILTSSGERVTSYLTATPLIPPDLPSSEQLQNSQTQI